jgi:elongation factor G
LQVHLRNKGVQPLLDAVIDYLPSPLDVGELTGHNPKTGEEEKRTQMQEPLAGLAFKIQIDPHVGKLTYFRVYSGKLPPVLIFITALKITERVGRILLMHANHREEIKEAYAGEIVALVGLKDTGTGDTLCDEKNRYFGKITFPEPVISLAIEPKTKIDQEKLGMALKDFPKKIRLLVIKTNHETNQTIISGMGEFSLKLW